MHGAVAVIGRAPAGSVKKSRGAGEQGSGAMEASSVINVRTVRASCTFGGSVGERPPTALGGVPQRVSGRARDSVGNALCGVSSRSAVKGRPSNHLPILEGGSPIFAARKSEQSPRCLSADLNGRCQPARSLVNRARQSPDGSSRISSNPQPARLARSSSVSGSTWSHPHGGPTFPWCSICTRISPM